MNRVDAITGALRQEVPESDAVPLLRIRLLGGFCVQRTDVGRHISDWQRRSAKTLTKLLAVRPGHALHREQIIDTLWSGVDPESALNSFGKALHAARHALEPELTRRRNSAFLRLADAVLALDTRHVMVDADRFEQLAVDAIRHGELEAYQAALTAYGGELLPEDLYASWCSERREALAELRVRLLLGMAEILEGRGAHNDAAERLRDVLQQDPTREAAHRQLMRLYARMGMPDQAVRHFHLCEDLLRRELDLAPQPETIALYEEIAAARLVRQPPRPDRVRERVALRPSAPVRAANDCPFVGRERVIERMHGQLARRGEAQSGMIIVSGETGVGKTRLLEEFTNQAREQGAVTLCGGRGAHASQFACGPFAVALEDYAACRPEAERADLARRYPALAGFVPSLRTGGLVPIQVPDPGEYHLALIPSIVQFLADLARRQPVLLGLGDLDEADAVGLDLIRYLAHLAVRIPLLMVGALRDPDMEPDPGFPQMVQAMTREHLWLRIDLHCLSRRTTDQLVRALLPGSRVSDDTLAEVYAQSRGNPLLIRELADSVCSRADLAPDSLEHPENSAAREGQAGGGGQVLSRLGARVPAHTRARVEMGVALLDDPLRRVLGLAAAAGTTGIPLSQLRSAAAALEPPLGVPALFDALDRALGRHVLEEREGRYAFRHPFVRSALYECLPRHRRDEFHAALATGA